MKSKPLAAIDIGTNTFRLLIAEVKPVSHDNYNIKELYSERVITRLGEGISETNSLKGVAIDRGIAALKKFRDIISSYQLDATAAVATSALREAKNSNRFLEKTKKATGFDIKIISEEEEARLTSHGIMMDIAIPDSAMMVDIGGGSTELIFVKKGKLSSIYSLNLGVVYLTDKYMKSDPPRESDIKKMDTEISQKFSHIIEPLKKLFTNETVLIGTAGTVTTLSAITQGLHSFNHSKVHNSIISLNSVEEIFSDISKISMKQRAKKYPVLESPRLDIIVPGSLILLKIMMTFGFKEAIVSDNGLREGILLDLYNKNRGR